LNNDPVLAVTRLCDYAESAVAQFSSGRAHLDLTMLPGLIDGARAALRELDRFRTHGVRLAHQKLLLTTALREVAALGDQDGASKARDLASEALRELAAAHQAAMSSPEPTNDPKWPPAGQGDMKWLYG
jgi:hypothetical protein